MKYKMASIAAASTLAVSLLVAGCGNSSNQALSHESPQAALSGKNPPPSILARARANAANEMQQARSSAQNLAAATAAGQAEQASHRAAKSNN